MVWESLWGILCMSGNAAIFQSYGGGIIVYSAGVGEDISFDQDIMQEYNHCRILAFDPTPQAIKWIKTQNVSDNYIFTPCGISGKTEFKTLYLSKNPDIDESASIYVHRKVSENTPITVQMKSLGDIAIENNHQYIDILKMDIEGSEFSVIENLPGIKNLCFGQIVVEFHGNFFKSGDKVVMNSLKFLEQNGYYCFAISRHGMGNEFSFINKQKYHELVENK
jgi:FkbM family methyltransferase